MTGAHPLDDPADAAALARYADALASAVDAALDGWVQRCVARVLAAQGIPEDEGLARAVDEAAAAARADGMPRLRALLATDVDPSLHEPGLAWGAAKAHTHLARRRGGPGS